MDCDLATSVPDWIIDHPETAVVFNALGIDTSCEGKSLEYVCRQQNFDPQDVLDRLFCTISNQPISKSRSNEFDDDRLAGTIQQPITGYHTDDEGHWVAQLACGHNQHVRHDPPWMYRHWVTTADGRERMLGFRLDCKECEEAASPDERPH